MKKLLLVLMCMTSVFASTPEYSSYGITAPDSNLTGMAEYSSYGIDARGFNNYWLNSTGRYADSVCNWSNGSIPDSMDAVTTIGGGNKILFTAGTTYKMRTLTTSGTAGSPDTLQGGTLDFTGDQTVTWTYTAIGGMALAAGDTVIVSDGTSIDGGGNTGAWIWPTVTSGGGPGWTRRSTGVDLMIGP